MLGVLELRQYFHANYGNLMLYRFYLATHGEHSSSTSTTPFDAQRTSVDERKTWHSESQRNMRLQDKRFPQQELSICLSVSERRPVWADWKLLAPFQAAELKLQGVKWKLKRCTSLWPLIGRVYGLLRVKLNKLQMQWNKQTHCNYNGCGNTSEERPGKASLFVSHHFYTGQLNEH